MHFVHYLNPSRPLLFGLFFHTSPSPVLVNLNTFAQEHGSENPVLYNFIRLANVAMAACLLLSFPGTGDHFGEIKDLVRRQNSRRNFIHRFK